MSAQLCSPHDLQRLHQRHATALVRALARRFPAVCEGRVEDAVATAFLQLCARPELWATFSSGDDHGAWRVLFLLAWRDLRGQCRRRSYQAEGGTLDLPAANRAGAGAGASPEEELRASELDARVRALVVEAARRCGGRRSGPLERALLERIYEERSDGEAASRHGLPREYVCRGRGHVARGLSLSLAA